MSIFYALLVLCISGKTFAYMMQPGKCPNYDSMEDFDIRKFRGKWYAHSKLNVPNRFIAEKCVMSEFTIFDNNTFQEIETVIDRKKGWKMMKLFTYRVPNPADPGKFMWKATGSRAELNEQVLQTDYKSYALMYGCDNVGVDHEVHAYLMTREQHPAKIVVDKVAKFFRKYDLPKEGFRTVKQTDCDMRPDEQYDV